jgi:hypothetical protein
VNKTISEAELGRYEPVVREAFSLYIQLCCAGGVPAGLAARIAIGAIVRVIEATPDDPQFVGSLPVAIDEVKRQLREIEAMHEPGMRPDRNKPPRFRSPMGKH